jgi:hypothetical protein
MLRKIRSFTTSQKHEEISSSSSLRGATVTRNINQEANHSQKKTPISDIGYNPYGYESSVPSDARDTTKFSRSHSRSRILLARLFHLGERRSRHHSAPTTPAISATTTTATTTVEKPAIEISNLTNPFVLMDGIVTKLSSTKLWRSKPSYLVVLAMPSNTYILRQYRKEGDDVPIREFTLSYDDFAEDLPRDPKAEPTDISHCFQLVTRERSRPFKIAAKDIIEKQKWIQTIRYCIACLRCLRLRNRNSLLYTQQEMVPHQTGFTSFQSLSLSSSPIDATSSPIHSNFSTLQEKRMDLVHPMISFSSSSGSGSNSDVSVTSMEVMSFTESKKKEFTEVEQEEVDKVEEDQQAQQARGHKKNNNNNKEEEEKEETPEFQSASSSYSNTDGTMLREMTYCELKCNGSIDNNNNHHLSPNYLHSTCSHQGVSFSSPNVSNQQESTIESEESEQVSENSDGAIDLLIIHWVTAM